MDTFVDILSKSKYIIKTTEDDYFAGWDAFGHMQFTADKTLAYRMLRTVAQNTFPKIKTAEVIMESE